MTKNRLELNFFSETVLIYLSLDWSQSSGRKTRTRLSLEEKKLICQFHIKHPKLSERKITEHFQKVFGKAFGHMTTNRTLKKIDQFINLSDDVLSRGKQLRPEKEHQLMDELFEEIMIRKSLSENFVLTGPVIKQIAEELAGHEKYKTFFLESKLRFGEKWISNWRRIYNVPAKKMNNES